MPDVNVEWGQGPDFAEVAEALGVRTDQIMAVMQPKPGEFFILYTPDDDTLIYTVTLRRDADSILVVYGGRGGPTPLPGMWEELMKRMTEEEQ